MTSNHSTLKSGARLRQLLSADRPSVLLEAHDALSARIVEAEGLEGIWASSLTIAATHGLRDANELTWTQVLDVLEHMGEATALPILVDGDSGHGDFNTVRRFVRKLSRAGLAGVCFEDQRFPKENSLIRTEGTLASIPSFSGKIRAAKDAQQDEDFVVVARVEAFIAGLGLDEAMLRAEAYHSAGADAILIHSRRTDADEVLAFAREWACRSPLLIVPTTYASTPQAAYGAAGINAIIWANHTLRAAIHAMRGLCRGIKLSGAPSEAESPMAPLDDVFALTIHEELAEARRRYETISSTYARLPDSRSARPLARWP
jgi:phosphoenolpyruvate phosphomutase